uniref:Uncharacterized protein n=1 Tax=Anguilla anguilla TaxID=7936 RepID=A0A0E9X3R9_ANGAN
MMLFGFLIFLFRLLFCCWCLFFSLLFKFGFAVLGRDFFFLLLLLWFSLFHLLRLLGLLPVPSLAWALFGWNWVCLPTSEISVWAHLLQCYCWLCFF